MRWGFVTLSFLFIFNVAQDTLDAQVLYQLDISVFVAPFTFYSLSILLNGVSWATNLKLWGIKDISLSKLLKSTGLTLLGKYLPGKIFGLTARMFEYRTETVTFGLLLSMTFLEQIAILQANAFLTIIFLSLTSSNMSLSSVGVIIGFSGFFINFIYVFSAPTKALLSKLKAEKCSTVAFPERSYKLLTLISACSIFANSLALYFLLVASFESLAPAWSYVIFCAICSFLLGFVVPLAPAGLGVRDLGLVGLLSAIMAPDDAAYIVIIFRLMTISCDILWGLCLLFLGSKAKPQ